MPEKDSTDHMARTNSAAPRQKVGLKRSICRMVFRGHRTMTMATRNRAATARTLRQGARAGSRMRTASSSLEKMPSESQAWGLAKRREKTRSEEYTECGRDGRTGVCTGNADAARVGRHCGVITGDAVMAAVSDGYHAHAVFLCLFDSHAHRFVADDLTHAVVTVNDRRCGRFAHDFEICHGVLDACLDTVDVDGLEAVDAVAFNAALVGGEKHVGADFGVLAEHTHSDKCVGDEAVKSFPVADYFCHWFCSFLGKMFPYSPRSVSADAFLRLTNGVTTYL